MFKQKQCSACLRAFLNCANVLIVQFQ